MNKVPTEYKKVQRYLVLVYDTIAEVLKQIEKNGLLVVNFAFKMSTHKNEFEQLKNDQVFEWLKKNGYSDVINKLTFNQCFAGLLSDLLQFTSNALRASELGQLNVTFALLRKPLKESLFYLEYLASNESEFIQIFNSDEIPDKLAVDKVPKDKKLEIIAKTCNIIKFDGYSPEKLYDVRYNKKGFLSFEPLFQTATHLITQTDQYRTEEGNFNFIFSNYEDKLQQWEFLYATLPMLMLYTYDLCSYLFSKIGKRTPIWDLMNMRFNFGYLYSTKGYKFIKEGYTNYFKNFNGKCQRCNSTIIFDYKQFFHFYYSFEIKCFNCGEVHSLAKN